MKLKYLLVIITITVFQISLALVFNYKTTDLRRRKSKSNAMANNIKKNKVKCCFWYRILGMCSCIIDKEGNEIPLKEFEKKS